MEADRFGAKNVSLLKMSKRGGLWIKTDKGVGYFNGFYTDFLSQIKGFDSLVVGKQLLDAFEDSKNRIWLYFQDKPGFTCVDPIKKTIKNYLPDSTKKNSIPPALYVRMIEKPDGGFWFTTWGDGIIETDSELNMIRQFKRKDPASLKANEPVFNQIKDMCKISATEYLVVYFDNEFSQSWPQYFNTVTGKFRAFPLDSFSYGKNNEYKKTILQCLPICHFCYKDEYGCIWFGTYSGLVVFDTRTHTAKRVTGKAITSETRNTENTRSFTFDGKGNMWVNTTNSGILIVNQKTHHATYHRHRANSEITVNSDMIGTMLNDKEGNIWVSTGNAYPSIYTPLKQNFNLKSFDALNLSYSDASGTSIPINCMSLRGNHLLYMSSNSGLTVYDYLTDSVIEMIYHQSKIKNEFSRNHVNDFRFYKNYIVFNYGFHNRVYNLKKKKLLFDDNRCIGHFFFRHDSLGPLITNYTGRWQEIYKIDVENNYKPEVYFKFPEDQGPDPGFNKVLNNAKWFFFHNPNSFSVIDPKTKNYKFYHKNKEKGILFPDSNITTMFYSEQNSRMWIATSTGLCSYDEKTETIKSWPIQKMIPNETFGYVAEDLNGRVWITGKSALYKIDFKNETVEKFSRENGMKGISFSNSSKLKFMLRAPNGYLFFPTNGGLLIIDPEHVKLPEVKPILSIYRLTVNDTVVDETELKTFATSTTKFDWDKNNLVIDVITGQLFTPSPTSFSYQLTGTEDKWIDNGNSNSIKLNNLPDGSYTLKIKAINSYYKESDVLTINFIIKKPFWKTLWFIISSIITLIVLIILFVKFRERELNKKKEELERTVNERTQEIQSQKEIIEEKQKEIVDSINYAKRIQYTLLAHDEFLNENIPQHFAYFNAKDIVSGDFYWATKKGNKFYLAVCDSTGHGVPGAFMSLLNIGYLNEAINEKGIEKPNEVFDYVRMKLIHSISKEGQKDGFDGVLICIDQATKQITYAAANNKPVIVQNNELKELESDRMPVGIGERKQNFTLHSIPMKKGDFLYLYTDGYADQFGGLKGKKFKYRQLNELLLSNHTKPMNEQYSELKSVFESWKGDLEQVDDVCILGIRI